MTGTTKARDWWARMRKYGPLAQELVKRDVRLKYRRSVLGYVWSLLNPLLMMAVMTVVFSYMFRFDIPNYPLYLICGQTLYGFFNEATNLAMNSIVQNASLIKKVYIPKYIFPLSKVLSCFVTMLFSLAAIFIVMVATRAPVHASLLLSWAPVLLLLIFSGGVGMILAALAVQFRDVTHLYGVVTVLWMYLTPVFYPLSAVPAEVARVIACNPLHIYISLFRQLVLYGNVPVWTEWLCGAAASAAALALGALIFGRMQRNFILYI